MPFYYVWGKNFFSRIRSYGEYFYSIGDNQLIYRKYLTVATIKEFYPDDHLNAGNKISYAIFRSWCPKITLPAQKEIL